MLVSSGAVVVVPSGAVFVVVVVPSGATSTWAPSGFDVKVEPSADLVVTVPSGSSSASSHRPTS
jgi:hypothetical protein